MTLNNLEQKIIKIYCDSGADIRFLKGTHYSIMLFQYPYDSKDRNKKQKMELASPSKLTWNKANTIWEESNFSWENCDKSEIYESLVKIVGKANCQNDILHLDSAYKSGCRIFLTSDKDDICSKRTELEPICKFKIFFHKDVPQIIDYIKELLSSNEGQMVQAHGTLHIQLT